MTRPVRIAIFGNGFARRAQLPALRWAGDNVVVGLAGHDAERARATAHEWEIPHATDNWRELLDDRPDLVLITTPVDLHAPMARAAFDAGAAVVCEKPFALDLAEARELRELAAGRAAWIDHELRWNPLRRRMRELLIGGAIGEPWLIDSRMCVGSPSFESRHFSWWFEAARGGGILGALGSHMIDALRHDLGEVEAVRAELTTCRSSRADRAGELQQVTADDHATLQLRMASGARAELVMSAVRPSEHDTWLEIEGSEGALRLVADEALYSRRRDESEWRPLPIEPGLPSAESLGMPFGGAFARSLPLFLRDVIRAVADGRTDLPGAATFDDGCAVQAVLDAARRSARESSGWATPEPL